MKRRRDWDKSHTNWWPEEGEMAERIARILFTTGIVKSGENFYFWVNSKSSKSYL